jgi:hypothetical protein
MFYFQTTFYHVILFRVAHSFPPTPCKAPCVFFLLCLSYALYSFTWLLSPTQPDCRRLRNPIVVAFRTWLSSPVQTGCHRYENQIVNTIKPDCHRQHNPIVINSTPRLSLLLESDCQRHVARLSSPVQPDCYRYENQIVITIKPDYHRRYNPSSPARCLSSAIQCTLHLLQPSGVVRGGQTPVSILAGFKFWVLFLLAANDIGVYEAPSVSHMVRSCAVLTTFVS